MRIAHLVAYISPDGSYGGPTRVCLSQAAALVRQGHEVTVFAGSPASEPSTRTEHGVVVKSFPASLLSKRLGFAGLRSPALARAWKDAMRETDVAHIHLARDLLTMPAARAATAAGVPYLAQTHGMIDPSDRLLARPVDAMWTRSVLRRAHAVLTLTDRENADLAAVAPGTVTVPIRNGVEVGAATPLEGRPPHVLFLSRLHPRKRALAFIEMARMVAAKRPDATFTVAGPDEGDGPAVRAAIQSSHLGDRLRWVGAVGPESTRTLLEGARILVLPSVGEVFPMVMLEAFAAGTPVVATESLGIAGACRQYHAAEITDGSPAALAHAVTVLLDSDEEAQALRAGAARYVAAELDIDAIARRLTELYQEARGVAPQHEPQP